MGKGIKRPVKAEKSDFKKKKLKVGRKLTKQANETKIDVRVAKLSLPTLPLDDGSAADQTAGQGQASVHDVLRKLAHHNAKVRKTALHSLSTLLSQSCRILFDNLAAIFELSIPCLHDEDHEIRTTFLAFWRECIQQSITQEMMVPFVPLVMANIRSACSHLNISLRLDALQFLRLLISHCPVALMHGHAASLMRLFTDILSQKHRERSLAAHAFSVTSISVTTLEGALAQACVMDQPSSTEQQAQPMLMTPQPKMQLLGPEYSSVGAFIQIPGVSSFALNGDDHGMGLARYVGAAWSAEVGLGVHSALFDRLRSCWHDCGPVEAAATPDEAKLTCMASILNCMRHLYSFNGTGSGATDDIRSKTAAFIHAQVLVCFPVATVNAYKSMQFEAAQSFNQSASKLLIAVSGSWSWSAQPRDSEGSRSVVPGVKVTAVPELQTQRTGACEVLQACVSSSQAFAKWNAEYQIGNRASSEVYGNVSAGKYQDNTSCVASESILTSMLTYCKLIVKASKDVGSEATGQLHVSSMHLRDVLQAAGSLLELVWKERHEDLLKDITELLTCNMSAAKLQICARFALQICRAVETRSAALVEQHMLQAWVESLSHTFVEHSMVDKSTLEVLLRCRLCLCRLDLPGDTFADKLLHYGVSVALVDPDDSVAQSLQALVAEILSSSRVTNSTCCLLCQALENGSLCPRIQLLVANTLLATL